MLSPDAFYEPLSTKRKPFGRAQDIESSQNPPLDEEQAGKARFSGCTAPPSLYSHACSHSSTTSYSTLHRSLHPSHVTTSTPSSSCSRVTRNCDEHRHGCV